MRDLVYYQKIDKCKQKYRWNFFLLNCIEIYWRNNFSLCLSIYTDGNFLSVYTSDITMGKEWMRKKNTCHAYWRFCWRNKLVVNIYRYILQQYLSFNLASEPTSPSPPFLLLPPLFFSTNNNRNPPPLFLSRIKLSSLQIRPPQHSVCQHPCSGSIVFRILHIK